MDITQRIAVGDIVTIPAWRVRGACVATRPATLGSEAAQDVQLQKAPGDWRATPRWYRLEPGDFTVGGAK